MWPVKNSTSVPHTPTRATSTTTSPGPADGAGTSSDRGLARAGDHERPHAGDHHGVGRPAASTRAVNRWPDSGNRSQLLGRQVLARGRDQQGVEPRADERRTRHVRRRHRHDGQALARGRETAHLARAPDRDPQVAVGVDAQAVGRAVVDMQHGRALAPRARRRVVRAGPHDARRRVDAVQRRAVGRPAEAVGEREVVVDRGDRAVGVQLPQTFLADAIVQRHAADEEPAGRIARAVVEPAVRGRARSARRAASGPPSSRPRYTSRRPATSSRPSRGTGDGADRLAEAQRLDRLDRRRRAASRSGRRPALMSTHSTRSRAGSQSGPSARSYASCEATSAAKRFMPRMANGRYARAQPQILGER